MLLTGAEKRDKRRLRPLGAFVEPEYSVRKVRYLIVSEDEWDTKQLYDQIGSFALAAGASLISFGTGLFVTAAFADHLQPAAMLLRELVAPVACAAGVLSFCAGIWLSLRRRAQRRCIDESSRPVTFH